MRCVGYEKSLEIRRVYAETECNASETARRCGCHRQTVAAVLQRDYSKPRPPRAPKTHQLDAEIESLLRRNELELREYHKNKVTARRIGHKLREAGAVVSQRTIDRRVKAVRAKLSLDKRDEALLLLGKPAGHAQVDFGVVSAIIAGKTRRLNLLICSLPQSNASFAVCTEAQDAFCLFDGLGKIFAELGGVPPVIRFDNLSPVVACLKGNERSLTEAFRRFELHYHFKSEFCNPAKGHEKGSVENKVCYIRRNFFLLGEEYKSLAALNQAIAIWCREDMNRPHYRRDLTIAELFDADKSALLPMPTLAFEHFEQISTTTDKQGFVRFGKNFYFAGRKQACKPVLLSVSVSTVTIFSQEFKQLAEYPRSYEQNRRFQALSELAEMLSSKLSALPYSVACFESGRKAAADLAKAKPSERIGPIIDILRKLPPEHIRLIEASNFKPDLNVYDQLLKRASNERATRS